LVKWKEEKLDILLEHELEHLWVIAMEGLLEFSLVCQWASQTVLELDNSLVSLRVEWLGFQLAALLESSLG
jgi:ligand-binding sensor domain-containing protein